ncbi:hypothetical protein EHV15_28295 [Paenibacillus oralis]|uniref:Uncharacterized protein n=1 Tax=Paenibacillus oralis TaxID=2490856 RepID=A0A3P3U9M8_9BACL|nr:hypothetical protein [Paenibacillus oralis]RRJ66386.1 hypothetical protein EHV15_28295 [Paenibacillus oralis]
MIAGAERWLTPLFDINLYDYQTEQGCEYPSKFLAGFSGDLQTDGDSLILEAFSDWLKAQQSRVLSNGLLGTALSPAINQWEKLTSQLSQHEIGK